ncbi:Glutaminyl-tRNA synthetase, partial [Coemansia erecta]
MDNLTSKFESLGLAPVKAKEAAGNKKLAPTLNSIIDATGKTDFDKPAGMLLYTLATTVTKDKTPHADYIAKAISAGRIASTEQLSAATKFCVKSDPTANEQAFDEACGVGVVVSEQEIADKIHGVIESSKDVLLKERYRGQGKVLGTVKKLPELRWADSAKVKSAFDAQIIALLGPKDERDDPAAAKKAAAAAAAAKAETAPKSSPAKEAAEPKRWEPMSLESMFVEGDIS